MDWVGNPAEHIPAINGVLGEPVTACGLSAWARFGPGPMEGNGDAVEYSQDSDGVGLTHSTLVLLPNDIQNVVSFVFDAPALPLQCQPVLGAEFFEGSRSGQPSVAQGAVGTDATIHAGDLKRSGQPEFLGLNAPRDDGAILGSSLTESPLLMLRGERSPAGDSELF